MAREIDLTDSENDDWLQKLRAKRARKAAKNAKGKTAKKTKGGARGSAT